MKLALLNESGIGTIDIKGTLDEYYDLIECDCIDIVTRKVGDTYFDIICDDEGLLKDSPRVSAVDMHCNPMLVGNLIFSHTDDGETVGITDDEIEFLKEHIGLAISEQGIFSNVIQMDY